MLALLGLLMQVFAFIMLAAFGIFLVSLGMHEIKETYKKDREEYDNHDSDYLDLGTVDQRQDRGRP